MLAPAFEVRSQPASLRSLQELRSTTTGLSRWNGCWRLHCEATSTPGHCAKSPTDHDTVAPDLPFFFGVFRKKLGLLGLLGSLVAKAEGSVTGLGARGLPSSRPELNCYGPGYWMTALGTCRRGTVVVSPRSHSGRTALTGDALSRCQEAAYRRACTDDESIVDVASRTRCALPRCSGSWLRCHLIARLPLTATRPTRPMKLARWQCSRSGGIR